MASKFLRNNWWWLKCRHPQTHETVRMSLETHDEVFAEMLRATIELKVELESLRHKGVTIPESVNSRLGLFTEHRMHICLQPLCRRKGPEPQLAKSEQRVLWDRAIEIYLDPIKAENTEAHAANKISMLRRFPINRRIVAIMKGNDADAKDVCRKSKTFQEGYFSGQYLDEVTSLLVRDFIESLGLKRKTMWHYRELFHHFFEVSINFGLYSPKTGGKHNPIAALPSYLARNKIIRFLKPDDIEQQLRILMPYPAIRMAVSIMIYAGLRRAEVLWLTRDCISADLGYISVINKIDEDSGEESSLKTGERTVTILPALKRELEIYLKTLEGNWLIPNGAGDLWNGDSFGDKLRTINRANGLSWNCLLYRHTFATQRATEGWSLFRIAKEMGNSTAVVEQYYAGFIRPEFQ